MLRVGLTGGICSGKTTVAEMLVARGCRLLPADRIAHELMAPGGAAHDDVVREFGRDILAAAGTIDRAKLGGIVFANAARRARLNAIAHPRVIEELERECARIARFDSQAIAVVEAALLVEAGYHSKLDKLIVAWCKPEQQLERLMQRAGLSRADAEQRLTAQLPVEAKRRLADYEIDCSGTLDATEQQVEKVHAELAKLAHAAPARRA